MTNNTLCQQYLSLLYQGAKGHQSLKRSEQNTIPLSYGEILYPGVDRLLAEVVLSEKDVFLDLGSGLGKVVLQVFLKTAVKKACGIEILPDLHQQSLAAAKKVQEDLSGFFTGGRQLNFVLGSFLTFPLTEATVVLIGSPCFTPKMLDSLSKNIDSSPHIHTVFSLRPLCALEKLAFKKAIRIEGSWDTTLCYIYQ